MTFIRALFVDDGVAAVGADLFDALGARDIVLKKPLV